MTANGVALSTAQLSFSITSDKNPLNGVKLPDPFPFTAANPHTFSLGDKNGQMLLQLRSLRDASPAPPGDVSVKISLTDKRARYRVDGGVYTDAKTFVWPQGSTHIIDFPVGEDSRQYSQLQNSRWSFGGWSESSGVLDISGTYSATIVANPDLEIVGSVGGFQHVFQMNFFGEMIDLTGGSGAVTTSPTCGTTSTGNPDTLRSGRVIMDGTCYWHLNAVATELQGKGYGRRAWSAMLQHAQANGARRVRTSIVARNHRVLNLYARLGFRFPPPLMTLHWVRSA